MSGEHFPRPPHARRPYKMGNSDTCFKLYNDYVGFGAAENLSPSVFSDSRKRASADRQSPNTAVFKHGRSLPDDATAYIE